jgi:TPR repeat protein
MARWKPNTRAVPCLSFTAMVLTSVMMGSAAAGLTLLSASERSYRDYYEAAVRGDLDAQANLAVLHANDAGGPRSDAYAFQWFMRAAGQGHAQAQLMLSEIFAAGKGVPRNSLAAYKWAAVAAASAREPQTMENAARMLERLAAQNVRRSNRRSTVARGGLEAEAGAAPAEQWPADAEPRTRL